MQSKILLLCLFLLFPVSSKALDYNQIMFLTATKAAVYGVNPQVAIYIIDKESSGNPDAIGDHGLSRGLVQINKKYHPEISDEEAFDPLWSINYLIQSLSKGMCGQWSTCPDSS